MPPHDPTTADWFSKEVQPLEPAFRSWLKKRFPTLGDTDDLVQESYARLLRTRRTGSIACAKAFLYVTARNLALNRLRHLRYERPENGAEMDTSHVVDDTKSIPESISHAEDLQLLVHAIQSLPDRCRQVITLRKIYGLSQKEVAEKMGISEHTVEAQGAIGLRKCIGYFRSHGYGRRVRK